MKKYKEYGFLEQDSLFVFPLNHHNDRERHTHIFGI